jgi:hypothetical protein
MLEDIVTHCSISRICLERVKFNFSGLVGPVFWMYSDNGMEEGGEYSERATAAQAEYNHLILF